MIKMTCDGCGKPITKTHESGGNISSFDLTDVCDNCWEHLDVKGNAELEAFDEKAVKDREAKIAAILKGLK